MISIPSFCIESNFILDNNWNLSKTLDKINISGLEVSSYKLNNDDWLIFFPYYNRKDLSNIKGLLCELEKILDLVSKPKPKRDFFLNDSLLFTFFGKKREEITFFSPFFFFCFEIITSEKKIEKKKEQKQQYLLENGFEIFNDFRDDLQFFFLETGKKLIVLDYEKIPSFFLANFFKKEFLFNLSYYFFSEKKNFFSFSDEDYFFYEKKKYFFDDYRIKKETKRVIVLLFNIQQKNTFLSFSFKDLLSEILFELKRHEEINFLHFYFFDKEIKNKKRILTSIDRNYLSKKLGFFISENHFNNILSRNHLSFELKENFYDIDVSFRPDLLEKDDLLKEVLKFFDLNDSFFSKEQSETTNFDFSDDIFINLNENLRSIKKFFSFNGWNEIITYSLIKEEGLFFSPFFCRKNCLLNNIKHGGDLKSLEDNKLANYKLEFRKFYRSSVSFSHYEIIMSNIARGNEDLFFFEISNIFSNEKTSKKFLCLSACGYDFSNSEKKIIDLSYVKNSVENFLLSFGFKSEFFSFKNSLSFNFCNKFSNALEIICFSEDRKEKKNIGFLFSLNEFFYKKGKIEIFFVEIDLNELFSFEKKKYYLEVKTPSIYPSIHRDISVLFNAELDLNYSSFCFKIENEFDLVQEVFILDLYQDSSMIQNKKESVTFRIIFQSYLKTLENSEIDPIISILTKRFFDLYGAEIR